MKIKKRIENEKKFRSDKRIRVNPSLSQENMDKLERLALACGNIPKTKLAAEILEFALNHPTIINHFQEVKFPYKNNYLKIIPIVKDGKCYYNNLHD